MNSIFRLIQLFTVISFLEVFHDIQPALIDAPSPIRAQPSLGPSNSPRVLAKGKLHKIVFSHNDTQLTPYVEEGWSSDIVGDA